MLPEPGTTAPRPRPQASATVLHLDHSPANRHLRARALEQAGFHVIEAGTIEAGWQAILAHRPDVVLADVMLPDGDAFDLTRRLKADVRTANVRVVQTSAHFTDAAHRVRGLDSGADAYLIEPVEPAELVAVLRAVVRGRRTEALLETILSRAPLLIVGADADGRVVFFNEASEALTGHRGADIIGSSLLDTLVAPADRDEVARRFQETSPAALAAPHANRWRTAAGDDVLIEWRCFHVQTPDHGLVTLGVGHDITRARQVENALRLSERQLRAVIDHTTALVYMVGADSRFILINRAFGALFDLDPQMVTGRSLHEVFPAETAHHFEANNQSILASGRAMQYEETVPQRDGPHTYLSSKSPLYDEDGRAYAICGVSADITARKKLEEALKAADRRKDAFIATIAHELRQPLAPIVTAVELMKGRASREVGHRARQSIERQVQQMQRLIDDMLDAARIAQGKIEVRKERIALQDVLEHAVSTVQPLIADRDQTLEVRVPAGPIWMEADAHRLQQVFSNLLNNATKFTGPSGRIALTAETDGRQRVTVSVVDTGFGIAAEMLPHVFELFTQTAPDERGIGVGLAVVRGMVERHGGTVEARSDGPGRGSAFVVRLPLAGAALAGDTEGA